ncbi:hypothetical protein WMW72_06680 [Paenibacillus filicis]|uniref:Lipoprotein n=1 Tax=Paenibacillus filicis TaxID=669464 RepID=A0ABU9DFD3_9BACL
MLKKKRWLLAATATLVIVGTICWPKGDLLEVAAEQPTGPQAVQAISAIKDEFQQQTELAERVQREQINELELKRAALQHADSKTASEAFASTFAAYKEMHAKHRNLYANKNDSDHPSNQKARDEIEKKEQLIADFEHEWASSSKTDEQLLNEFIAAARQLNTELLSEGAE